MKKTDIFESSWSSAKVCLFDSPAEARLFRELCTRYKGRMIAPQVSFSALIPRGKMYATLRAILHTREPKKLRRIADYLAKSRVDFVVYDRKGRIEVVIECNGWTHRKSRRKNKDILKAKVLKKIGLPLVVHGVCDHITDEFQEDNEEDQAA